MEQPKDDNDNDITSAAMLLSSDTLATNNALHRNFHVCPVCAIQGVTTKFIRRGFMQRHLLLRHHEHRELADIPASSLVPRRIPCSHCPRTFSMPCHLTRHMLIHRSRGALAPAKPPTSTVEKPSTKRTSSSSAPAMTTPVKRGRYDNLPDEDYSAADLRWMVAVSRIPERLPAHLPPEYICELLA